MNETGLATSSEAGRMKDIEAIAGQVNSIVERLDNCATRIDEFLSRVSGGENIQQLKQADAPCRPGSLGGVEAQLHIASEYLNRLQASINQIEDIG